MIDRNSPDVARSIAESLLPRRDVRELALRWLRDAILHAESINPSSWSVTMKNGMVRLNVGPIEVLTIFPDCVHIVVHQADQVGKYRRAPGSVCINFPSSAALSELPRYEASHRRLIDLVAEKSGAWHSAHSIGVLRYIDGIFGGIPPALLVTAGEPGSASARGLRHYLAYHRTDVEGAISNDPKDPSRSIYTRKTIPALRAVIGQRIWLVEGTGTTRGASVYTLAYSFVARSVHAEDGFNDYNKARARSNPCQRNRS